MCRLAAWYGQPRPLSAMMLDAPFSLREQAYRPREMQFGTINVDGTGMAWWDPADRDAEPLRYVSPAPPWADVNLASLTPRLASHLQVQAVRSATAGIPYGTANVAPFVHDGLALAHNGFVEGFRSGTGGALRRMVDDDLVDAMDAVSDSLVLFMLLLTRLRAEGSLVAALQRTFTDVVAVCRDAGKGATLNVAVADGRELVVTRASFGLPHNSLYQLTSDVGTAIASEPLDPDQPWTEVPLDSAVVVDTSGVRIQPLDLTTA